ncbi:radical SAM protein, partial [Thermococcus sp.]
MKPLLFFDPKVGAFAYCPESGGIFQLEPDEYEAVKVGTEKGLKLIEEMRSEKMGHSISDFIGHLASLGILNDRLSHPVDVELEITRACNLRCTHCIVSAGEPLPDELPTERWVSLVEEIGDYAVRVTLTGGEPLVHPGFLDILLAAKKAGLAVRILTNGTLVPDFIDDLQGLLNPSTDEVQVSLDGTRDVNDSIRGAGSFDRAVRGIEALVGAGIPVSVAFTVLPQNRSSAIDLYRFVARLGVSSFRAGWGLPLGRQGSGVSYRSYLDLVAALREESRRYGVPVSGGDLGAELPV